MKSVRRNFHQRAGCLARLVAITGFALALMAPAAGAYPDSDFLEPGTWSFDVSASDSRAGVNPDLTIELFRKQNGCPPGTDGNRPGNCPFEEGSQGFHWEQDLKKMAISLPPGLMADANAAPYCEAYLDWLNIGFLDQKNWLCSNPAAEVGTAYIVSTQCYPTPGGPSAEPHCSGLGGVPGSGTGAQGPGTVYMERPGPGEQGHLVVLWPQGCPGPLPRPDSCFAAPTKTDISVKVREGDLGIDSIADEIPDRVVVENRLAANGTLLPKVLSGGQLFDLTMTLEGRTGAGRGHPLLSNPTFCSAQAIGAGLQGWANNSMDNFVNAGGFVPPEVDIPPPSGEGKVRAVDPFPYQATDCDAVPYTPTFTATADTDAPGAAPALSTVITQSDDEATTKKVHVEFPKGMGVNINSTLTPCSASDLAAKSCPEVSKMGTVSAESRLLPKREFLGDSVKPEDEVLTGSVYLTGLEGDKLTLSALLTGFIDIRLDAKAGVGADGTLTATFDDLPTLPYNKFTLNLFGGNRSLLTNPRKCGPATTTATFTSHSGKTHTVQSTSQVKGCNEPTFDAELSESGKGKRTGLELEVRSDQKPIKEVKFGIDRHMLLTSKGLGKKRKFGEVSVTSASGTQEAALKRSIGASQKKGKAFSLKVSALEGLGVNIYRKRFTRKGVKTFKHKSNRKKRILKKKTVPKNRVSVKPLPTDDTTKVSVSLNPDETKLLRNPKGKCRTNFIALIKTTDGVKYALTQKLKLRGKGCSKKKPKKK